MRAVVDAQNLLTESVLAQCETRDKFKALMTQMYDYPRFGCAAPRREVCSYDVRDVLYLEPLSLSGLPRRAAQCSGDAVLPTAAPIRCC